MVMVTRKQVMEFTKVRPPRDGSSRSSVDRSSQLSFASQIAFALSITAAKLSILFLYHRVFRTHRFKIIGIVLGLFLVGWGVAFPLTVVFNCTPISYFWDKSVPGGRCIDAETMSYVLATISTCTDVVVWALPIPWLWGLQMSVAKRLGIIATFALGGL
jgi:hypothetical protein